MSTIELNKPVPDFYVPATNNKDVLLSALKGYSLVLYFYPKDSTPGCTTEGQDFSAHYEEFKLLKTVVFGVSRDTLDSHEQFKLKQQFPFELISDIDETLCKLFDVIKTKHMYGRETLGLERSTFLIDSEGILRNQWQKVKVPGHVLDVLTATRSIYKKKYGVLPKSNANLKPTPAKAQAEAAQAKTAQAPTTPVQATPPKQQELLGTSESLFPAAPESPATTETPIASSTSPVKKEEERNTTLVPKTDTVAETQTSKTPEPTSLEANVETEE